MIKPFAFDKAQEIFDFIEKKGFNILITKVVQLSYEDAASFYFEHMGKPFFHDMVTNMSSGPIIVAVLEKENAVEDFRAILGATDPLKAEEGTIRKLFGKSKSDNSVHGSDSDTSSDREIKFFFYLDGFWSRLFIEKLPLMWSFFYWERINYLYNSICLLN